MRQLWAALWQAIVRLTAGAYAHRLALALPEEVAMARPTVDGGPITATNDVAHPLDMAPGAFFAVGAGGPGAVPHHHPAFEIDEQAIGLMSEILARAAIKVLHHGAGELVGAEGT